MLSEKNSKRIYYLTLFIGPIFYCIYLNEILHEINVFFNEIYFTTCKLLHQIDVLLFQLELTFFIIQVIVFYSVILLLLFRIKKFLSPVMNKLKIFLLCKLKNIMNTFSEKSRTLLYFTYYSIVLTSPVFILCCFFQDEVSHELFLFLFYLQLLFFCFEVVLNSFYYYWQ